MDDSENVAGNFAGGMWPQNLLTGCYLNPDFVSREVREVKDYAGRAEY